MGFNTTGIPALIFERKADKSFIVLHSVVIQTQRSAIAIEDVVNT